MTEADIQSRILVAITALPGAMFWRENSGVLFTPTGRPVRAGTPGVADIMGIYYGRGVGIEVKTPVGKQSKVQKNFQSMWESKGGKYFICTSPEAALAALAGIGNV